MTALELRHATIGYSERALRAVVGYPKLAVRSAVDAGSCKCRAHDPEAPDFAELVMYLLIAPDAWEWFPPPLLEETIEAIDRQLVAAAN